MKVGKKESAKSVAKKLRKVSAKTKKIDWDKYFGKIKFPVDALTYQKKMRDEWDKLYLLTRVLERLKNSM
jgi:hypothetical protein